MAVKADNLIRIYRTAGLRYKALKGVSIAVPPGTSAAITGPSGSGKSTLLRILAGIDRPTAGEVFLLGHNLTAMSEEMLTAFRRSYIGYVLQDYGLLPMSAEENVAFPLMLHGVPERERLRQAGDILQRLGLDTCSTHLPGQLSGGQQQRTAIARALITHPKIMFADEPTGSLDNAGATEIMKLLMQLVEEEKATLIFVTHDSALAECAGQILQLSDGMLCEG